MNKTSPMNNGSNAPPNSMVVWKAWTSDMHRACCGRLPFCYLVKLEQHQSFNIQWHDDTYQSGWGGNPKFRPPIERAGYTNADFKMFIDKLDDVMATYSSDKCMGGFIIFIMCFLQHCEVQIMIKELKKVVEEENNRLQKISGSGFVWDAEYATRQGSTFQLRLRLLVDKDYGNMMGIEDIEEKHRELRDKVNKLSYNPKVAQAQIQIENDKKFEELQEQNRKLMEMLQTQMQQNNTREMERGA